MSLDVLLECPRTSCRDVLRVNVTERVWIFPIGGEGGGSGRLGQNPKWWAPLISRACDALWLVVYGFALDLPALEFAWLNLNLTVDRSRVPL